MNKPLIVYIDAAALSNSSCLRRVYYNVVKGYRKKIQANDIEFGIAVHLFKAEIRKGTEISFLAGIKKALDYYKKTPKYFKVGKEFMTEGFLINVCNEYYIKYGEKRDNFEPIFHEGEPLTELKFVLPYYSSPELIVFLAGIIDEIGKIKNGCYAIADLKTTSVWDSKKYFEGYKLSPQLIFYRYMLKLHAKLYPDSIFAEIDKMDCACFIDGVFLSKNNPTEFSRSEGILFKQELLDEFEVLLHKKMQSIIEMIQTHIIPDREGMLNGACNTKYGLCDFFIACSSPDDVSCEFALENNFKQAEYNPLLIGEITP